MVKLIKLRINDALVCRIFNTMLGKTVLRFSLPHRVLMTDHCIPISSKIISCLCKIRLSWCHGEVSAERHSILELGNSSFKCKCCYNISFGWCKGMLLVSASSCLAYYRPLCLDHNDNLFIKCIIISFLSYLFLTVLHVVICFLHVLIYIYWFYIYLYILKFVENILKIIYFISINMNFV